MFAVRERQNFFPLLCTRTKPGRRISVTVSEESGNKQYHKRKGSGSKLISRIGDQALWRHLQRRLWRAPRAREGVQRSPRYPRVPPSCSVHAILSGAATGGGRGIGGDAHRLPTRPGRSGFAIGGLSPIYRRCIAVTRCMPPPLCLFPLSLPLLLCSPEDAQAVLRAAEEKEEEEQEEGKEEARALLRAARRRRRARGGARAPARGRRRGLAPGRPRRRSTPGSGPARRERARGAGRTELDCGTFRVSEPHVRAGLVALAVRELRRWRPRQVDVYAIGGGQLLLEWETLEALSAEWGAGPLRSVRLVDPLYARGRRRAAGSQGVGRALAAFAAWFAGTPVTAHGALARWEEPCSGGTAPVERLVLQLDCPDVLTASALGLLGPGGRLLSLLPCLGGARGWPPLGGAP
ncbi:unnamed protein product [Prorocentrum cordatum]|uniref:Uncharacterized protein n=1 Tax=Prorocentrum cordatum TaxID=2364126 RepID=A0ABN9SR25_9DINO|nr:unnamed protein product [Polarella glacialis]